MANIKLFENASFGSVRVVMRENDPWFVAADVCKCLDIRVDNAMVILDDDEKQLLTGEQFSETQSSCTPYSIGGAPNADSGVSLTCYPSGVNIISESGLYSLAVRSRKPEANAFRRWVTHDVLPSIRKTGMYVTPDFNDPAAAAEAWAKEYRAKQKAQLEAQAARTALSQKSAALAELLNDWGEGETFHSVIAESKRICKYYNVKYAIDPGDTVYKQLGKLMTKLCNGGYSSTGNGLIKDERFAGHRFPWKQESHPSSVFNGWNVYHIDAWAYLYEVIERDGAASLPYIGKFAK